MSIALKLTQAGSVSVHVDEVVCIVLDTDGLQVKQRVSDECAKIGIEKVKFHVAKRHQDPVRGCLESHKYILEYAKKKCLEKILILESDVVFTPLPSDMGMSSDLGVQWDMMYLGYHALNGYAETDNLAPSAKPNTHVLLRLTTVLTTHAYIIRLPMIDRVLEVIDTDWMETIPDYKAMHEPPNHILFPTDLRAIDKLYSSLASRNQIYGVYPMVASQLPGFSTIENKVVDYTQLMETRARLVSETFRGRLLGTWALEDTIDDLDEIKRALPMAKLRLGVGLRPCDYILFQVRGATLDLTDVPSQMQVTSKTPDVFKLSGRRYMVRMCFIGGSNSSIVYDKATDPYRLTTIVLGKLDETIQKLISPNSIVHTMDNTNDAVPIPNCHANLILVDCADAWYRWTIPRNIKSISVVCTKPIPRPPSARFEPYAIWYNFRHHITRVIETSPGVSKIAEWPKEFQPTVLQLDKVPCQL